MCEFSCEILALQCLHGALVNVEAHRMIANKIMKNCATKWKLACMHWGSAGRLLNHPVLFPFSGRGRPQFWEKSHGLDETTCMGIEPAAFESPPCRVGFSRVGLPVVCCPWLPPVMLAPVMQAGTCWDPRHPRPSCWRPAGLPSCIPFFLLACFLASSPPLFLSLTFVPSNSGGESLNFTHPCSEPRWSRPFREESFRETQEGAGG